MREPMLVLDHDLRIESVNRSFYLTFRVTPAETVGSFIYELGNRQWNIPRLLKSLHETLAMNQSIEDFEVEHHFEQLGDRIMLLNARRIIDPMKNSERILLAIEDITDRKQVEDAQRQSRERILLATEAAQMGFWSWRPDEDFVVWENEYPYQIIGVPLGSPPVTAARFVADFLHPDDAPAFEQSVAKTLQAGQPFAFVGRIRRPDGEERWVEFTGKSGEADDERGQRIVGTVQDITDRKRAEFTLTISEIRYRRLFESAKDGILILEADAATITDANPFTVDMLGYSQDELVGKELWEIGLFKDVEANKAAMQELQENRYIRHDDLPLETKAGQRITVPTGTDRDGAERAASLE